jgi:formate/nitrite transporter
MSSGFYTPPEITTYVLNAGYKKSILPAKKMLLLSIMAGIFLSLAAHGTVIASHNIPYPAAARIVSAVIFPVGLILILLSGCELFTGNCLIIVSCLQKKAKWKYFAKSLFFVYLGNLLGSLAVVFSLSWFNNATHADPLISAYNIKVAAYKSSLTPAAALLSGIFANLLVCMGVWLCYAAKSISGKIMGVFYPVFLFIILGVEHVIANMYYIPMGLLAKANDANIIAAVKFGVLPEKLSHLTLSNSIINNFIPVTIGNIIGGAIAVGAFFWLVFLKEDIEDNKTVLITKTTQRQPELLSEEA